MGVNKNNVKIHISHLKKNFGKLEVLKDVSTDIYEGEVVVVLGPSGSGKSTLLRCLNRLEDITAGEGTNLTICCSTFFDENDESSTQAAEFVQGFKAWLNANPDKMTNNGGNDIVAAVTALGYDAYMTAIEAIKAADSAVGADIAAALPGVTLTGVTGSISFDEIGDANKDMAYIKKVNTETGAFDFEKTQSVAALEK